MKRLLSLLVTGSLLVTPVLAAQTGVEDSFPAVREPASFADVASGGWYTDAAGLCYVTGLLNGTGNGNFSPAAPSPSARLPPWPPASTIS